MARRTTQRTTRPVKRRPDGLSEESPRYIPHGIDHAGDKVRTAKLFKNGRSQAVRLPKEFRFEGDEVYVKREGEAVVLTPKPRTASKKNPWQDFFDALDSFDPRFPLERDQPPMQVRKSIDEMRPARRRRPKGAK